MAEAAPEVTGFPGQIPTQIVFDVKRYLPVRALRTETCKVPFIIAHGPHFLEFELDVNIAGSNPRYTRLSVTWQSTHRLSIPGHIAMRIGAARDANNLGEAETPLYTLVKTTITDLFTIHTGEEFLPELQRTVGLEEYTDGSICFRIFLFYRPVDFIRYNPRNIRLTLLNPLEERRVQEIDDRQDFQLLNITSNDLRHSKWLLYITTKYFHRLIDRYPSTDATTLEYSEEVIENALSLTWYNHMLDGTVFHIDVMLQTMELICKLETINMEYALEYLAVNLERDICQDWKILDLDDYVRMLTLPKYRELERLKEVARSVIIDAWGEDFEEEYNNRAIGVRGTLYSKLMSSGIIPDEQNEASEPVPSELQKLEEMKEKMKEVKKVLLDDEGRLCPPNAPLIQ